MSKRLVGLICSIALAALLTGCSGSKALVQRVSLMESRVARLETSVEQTAEDARNARMIANSSAQSARQALDMAQLAHDMAVGNIRYTEIRRISVYFAHGNAQLNGEALEMLAGVADEMRRNSSYFACVRGFADTSGDPAYNLILSTQRAENVHRVLSTELGADAVRLSSIGFGEDQPAADNDTEEGRRQNRRVEISLVQPQGTPLDQTTQIGP